MVLEELRGTSGNTTHDVTESHRYQALALLIIPVLTIFGNVLVVISVVRERSLQTVTNYCICSLAVSDFLVATCVMPFAVYVEVTQGWYLSAFFCDLYLSADVSGSTASILNLVAICVDRYLAITRPWSYSRRNKARAAVAIILVWWLALSVGLPVAFGVNESGLVSTGRNSTHKCVFKNDLFVITSSCISFFLPCIVMVVLYSIVFKKLLDRQKSLEQLGVAHSKARHQLIISNAGDKSSRSPCFSDSDVYTTTTGRSPSRHNRKVFFRSVSSISETENRTDFRLWKQPIEEEALSESDRISDRPEAIPETDRSFSTTEVIPFIDGNRNLDNTDCPPCNVSLDVRRESPLVEQLQQDLGFNEPVLIRQGSGVNHVTHRGQHDGSKFRKLMKRLSLNNLKAGHRRSQALTFRPSKTYRHDRRENKERRATITLAVVVGVFLACFVPFFACHVINSARHLQGRKDLSFLVFFITTWIGYMNSFMNPIIYTIFNPDFRKGFRRLLCRRSVHRTFG